jgi:hypothetical protein
VIGQLHDGGTNGSPPVALEVAQGHLWLSNVGQHVKDLGVVTPGRDLAVQLDVAFAKGAGTVSVVRDGQPVVTNFTPPKGTMVDDLDYLKTGIYKDPAAGDSDASLSINDEKIGSSLAQVGNLAGATQPAAAPAAAAPTTANSAEPNRSRSLAPGGDSDSLADPVDIAKETPHDTRTGH